MSEQIDQIKRMEQILNQGTEILSTINSALEEYQGLLPQIHELATYYQSPAWLQDRDDDDAGKLPQGLRRGVLSEDAVWNLLTEQARAVELMKTVVKMEADERA